MAQRIWAARRQPTQGDVTLLFLALTGTFHWALWPAARPGSDGAAGRLVTGANLSRLGNLVALLACSHEAVDGAYEALNGLSGEAKKMAVVLGVGASVLYILLEVLVRSLTPDAPRPQRAEPDDPESPAPRRSSRSRSRSPRRAQPPHGFHYSR